VSPGEAAVRSIFAREREAFAAWARGAPRVSRSALVVHEAHCGPTGRCGARDVAWADWGETGPGVVHLLRRAIVLPWENLVGLIRHEFGHLADPAGDALGAERRADVIAAQATGAPVRYDLHDLQSVHPDAVPARPPWLHD
jgi:hypothetical protein